MEQPALDVTTKLAPAIGEALRLPGFTPAGLPHPDANRIAQQEFPDEWKDLGLPEMLPDEGEAIQAPEGSFGVYTAYWVNFYTQMYRYYPYHTIGKLYFTTPPGARYCTASVVSPNKIIVTAAHCLYDTVANSWYANFRFVPAERNLVAPYGTFPFAGASVLACWTGPGNAACDVGVLRLGNNTAGHSVTFYTGWLGRWWDQSSIRHHHTFGYPANLANGNWYLRVCAAESYPSAGELGMGCDMKAGSNGGPWVLNFAPYVAGGAFNRVNAVTRSWAAASSNIYGTRFTANNIVPLCAAIGC